MAIKPKFDPEDFKVETAYTPVPVANGEYTMEIFSMSVQRSKNDTKTFLNVGLKHTGDQRGPTVWDFVSVEGTNAVGESVSLKKLYSLIKALGLPEETSVDADGIDSISPGQKLDMFFLIPNGDRISPLKRCIKVRLGQDTNQRGEIVNTVQFNYKSAE